MHVLCIGVLGAVEGIDGCSAWYVRT